MVAQSPPRPWQHSVTESPVALPPVYSPGEARVDQYIHRENIALFRKRLSETNDLAARRVLLKLLAEEEAKGNPSERGGLHQGRG
jgi:hypothetical protein